MDCYDIDESCVCRIDKNVLCLTDEQINKIAEYDKKKKAEELATGLPSWEERQKIRLKHRFQCVEIK